MKILLTTLMLICSNVFMTFAWYGHLSTLKGKFWLIAVFASWGVAFFEYMIMVPANRLGSEVMTLPQLKILQEAIALSVFVPFAIFFAKEHISWNYLWGALCIAGAVFFIFNDHAATAKTQQLPTPTTVQKVETETTEQVTEKEIDNERFRN